MYIEMKVALKYPSPLFLTGQTRYRQKGVKNRRQKGVKNRRNASSTRGGCQWQALFFMQNVSTWQKQFHWLGGWCQFARIQGIHPSGRQCFRWQSGPDEDSRWLLAKQLDPLHPPQVQNTCNTKGSPQTHKPRMELKRREEGEDQYDQKIHTQFICFFIPAVAWNFPSAGTYQIPTQFLSKRYVSSFNPFWG